MFILRRISGDGVEMNFELGQTYTIVERFFAYESFEREFERFFNRPHVADMDPTSDEMTKKVYAFVGTDGGLNIYPLYLGQKAYIMTDSGKTFNNLTIKPDSKPSH
jgi:hypothetical protein